MGLDIVMLNARKLLLYMAKPLLNLGEIMDHVVRSLIFGKQIKKQLHIQLILAKNLDIIGAMERQIVVLTIKDIVGFVIKMDVEIILTETVIKCFMGQAPIIKLTQQDHSQL